MNDEIRHVMHYLYLKRYTARSAMNEIHTVYGGTYPSYSTAKRMFEEFEEPEKPSSIIEKKKSDIYYGREAGGKVRRMKKSDQYHYFYWSTICVQ